MSKKHTIASPESISQLQSESFFPDFEYFLKNSSFFLIFTFFFLSNNVSGAPSSVFQRPKQSKTHRKTPPISARPIVA